MSSSRPLQQFAWALFDFGNSAFPAVITTFVFSAYVTKGIAPTPEIGTAYWGYMTSATAIVIALFAPLFGAIADHSGLRKRWIFACTLLCAFSCFQLWYATPTQTDLVWALVWVGVATFGFEMAMVFYNAMLPDLSTAGKEGKLSGFAWGMGYFGGLICLALLLVFFVQAEDPMFGLNKETAEHVRIAGPFTAIWYILFALPLFLFVSDRPKQHSLMNATRIGFSTLKATLKNWRSHKSVFQFLGVRMIYTDGLNTLFAFGGIYAAGTFNMSFSELIVFGIGLNVTAGLGAILFGWLDDRWGPKRVIMLSLFCLLGLSTTTLLIEDKTIFLIIGLLLGFFMGPTQAASRTYMSHISPKNIQTELFGLYALSGKATAFLGPLLIALVSDFSGSQRLAMATILIFFVIGLALLPKLPDIRGHSKI